MYANFIYNILGSDIDMNMFYPDHLFLFIENYLFLETTFEIFIFVFVIFTKTKTFYPH